MKRIWILNHYAGPPGVVPGLRHYNFAKELISRGYAVTIFASSAVHNSEQVLIEDDAPWRYDDSSGVPFVYLRTDSYTGRGTARLRNMWQYYRGVMKYADQFPRPDVIIGSSVHPLACLAALRLSKRYRCENIVEIRDLWPESFVAFGVLGPRNPVLPLLFAGEKWLYKKADRLIFTMPGGRQYLEDRGWGKAVLADKVYLINNGVDLPTFDHNAEVFPADDDPALHDTAVCKVVYAGSVRTANRVDIILDTAMRMKGEPFHFFIYGDGDARPTLEARGAPNVSFHGHVNKDRIPGILRCADVCWLHMFSRGAEDGAAPSRFNIFRYGSSLNKCFDYLAAGRPILSDIGDPYDLVAAYDAGIVTRGQNPDILAAALRSLWALSPEERLRMGGNARRAAHDYDFSKLTDRLIDVIEHRAPMSSVTGEKR